MSTKNLLLFILAVLITISLMDYSAAFKKVTTYLALPVIALAATHNMLRNKLVVPKILLFGTIPAILLIFYASITKNYFVGNVAMMYMIAAPLMVWAISGSIKTKKYYGRDLDEKVKTEMGIPFVKNFKIRFPEFANSFGGAVYPFVPVATLTNANWGQRSEEVIIHENMHLYLLIREGWLILFVAAFIMVGVVVKLLPFVENSFAEIFATSFMLAYFMTRFEKKTFENTKIYADKNNIPAETWSDERKGKYMMVYTTAFMLIRYAFMAVGYTFGIIKKLVGAVL